MKIKLYIDEDINGIFFKTLLGKGFDIISAKNEKNIGWTDLKQIEYATKNNRAIVTSNKKDFINIDKKFKMEGKKHCGIIILNNSLKTQEKIKRIIKLLETKIAEEIENIVLWA